MSHLNLVQPWAAQLSVLSSSVSDLVIGLLQTELVEQVNQTENLTTKRKKESCQTSRLPSIYLSNMSTRCNGKGEKENGKLSYEGSRMFPFDDSLQLYQCTGNFIINLALTNHVLALS